MRAREVVAALGLLVALSLVAWAAFTLGELTHPHKPKRCAPVVVIDGRLMVQHCPPTPRRSR